MLFDSIKAIQELKIEPEEILYLMQEMTKRHDMNEQADWYTSIAILAERYPSDPDRTFCISERMRCLLPLMKDARMRGWSFESWDDPECTMTNEAVFRAIAKCPLRGGSERMRFDSDEFFQIVLEDSKPDANA